MGYYMGFYRGTRWAIIWVARRVLYGTLRITIELLNGLLYELLKGLRLEGVGISIEA